MAKHCNRRIIIYIFVREFETGCDILEFNIRLELKITSSRTLPFQKSKFYLLQWKPFKNGRKGLDKKAKLNFKIHDVTNWETNKIQKVKASR